MGLVEYLSLCPTNAPAFELNHDKNNTIATIAINATNSQQSLTLC